VAQFKYRHGEYTITIATMRVATAIKVDTEVYLSPDPDGRVTNALRTGTSTLVPIEPIDDVLKKALEAGKHAADGLAAQAASRKAS
jgi:hypothetical protein